MRLVTSSYLRSLRGLDENFRNPGILWPSLSDSVFLEETILFHALFGKARIVSAATLRLLANCRKPIDIEEARKQSSPEVIEDLMRLNFLVPEESADESARIDTLLAERPKRLLRGEMFSALQLVLTNSCNFTCDYCFAYKFENNVSERIEAGERIPNLKNANAKVAEGNSAEKKKRIIPIHSSQPSIHMNFVVAEKAIDNAIRTRLEACGDRLAISLFGGEPTLNRSLILHLLRKYERGVNYGLCIDWDITTNGSCMDPELLMTLAKYDVDTAVSVDYIDAATGEFRGGAKQSAPWEVIEKSIDDMVAAGIPVHLTSVLSAQTWDKWGTALIDWAAEHDIHEINIIVSFDGKFFETHDPENIADRLFDTFAYAQERRVLLSGYWYQTYSLIVNEEKYARQADYKTCPAIGRMLSIEPNGSIFTCKATSSRVGDVANWADIFHSQEYQKYGMRAYRNSSECRGCELEGTCSGGSTGSLESTYGGAIEKMDPGYCTYMRRIVNRLLSFHLTRRQGLRPSNPLQ